jgi:hypothetical protein
MRRPITRAVTAAASLLLAAGVWAGAAEPGYGIEIEVVRDAERGAATTTATITDLATGEVLAAPRVTARLGEEAAARTARDGRELVLTVTVDESSVASELVVSGDAAVLHRQKTLIRG